MRNFLFMGVAPLLGRLILTALFFYNAVQQADPENSESGNSWFGLGPPLVIGVGFLLLGVAFMLLQRRAEPEFFRRRPQVVDPAVARGDAVVEDAVIAPDERV